MNETGSYEDEILETFSRRRLHLVPGSTNGRYGVDMLAAIAMMGDPDAVYEGDVFVFCHKSARQIRFLVWDDRGYWLITRKIYSGAFVWPERKDDQSMVDASVRLVRTLLRSPGSDRKTVEEMCSGRLLKTV
jgi:transposase